MFNFIIERIILDNNCIMYYFEDIYKRGFQKEKCNIKDLDACFESKKCIGKKGNKIVALHLYQFIEEPFGQICRKNYSKHIKEIHTFLCDTLNIFCPCYALWQIFILKRKNIYNYNDSTKQLNVLNLINLHSTAFNIYSKPKTFKKTKDVYKKNKNTQRKEKNFEKIFQELFHWESEKKVIVECNHEFTEFDAQIRSNDEGSSIFKKCIKCNFVVLINY